MKLFCFPHAGGFSLYYRFMKENLYDTIENVMLFDYPRRGFSNDGSEVMFSYYILSAVEFVRQNICCGEEYILFGHSMGAFVACEAGLILQNKYSTPPTGVIASGQNPPYSEKHEKGRVCLEEPYSFVEELGGVPDFIRNNKRFFSAMMKCITDDMKAIETYEPSEPSEEELLDCGMIIKGSDDSLIKHEYAHYWDKTFRRIYSDIVLPGNHFYFKDHTNDVTRLIDEFATAITNE